jgi:hypothetical protein
MVLFSWASRGKQQVSLPRLKPSACSKKLGLLGLKPTFSFNEFEAIWT